MLNGGAKAADGVGTGAGLTTEGNDNADLVPLVLGVIDPARRIPVGQADRRAVDQIVGVGRLAGQRLIRQHELVVVIGGA